jgi:predicted RNA-binding protein Jag
MNDEIKSLIIQLTTTFCAPLGFIPNVIVSKEKNQYRINIKTTSPQILRARNNELLLSLQYLTRVVVHKQFPEDRTHFLFDVNSARQTREKIISQILPDLVIQDVVENGIPLVLKNLNGYERKLVHDRFAGMKVVTTRSLGGLDDRKLIIESTSDLGVQNLDNAKILNLDKLLLEYEDKLI